MFLAKFLRKYYYKRGNSKCFLSKCFITYEGVSSLSKGFFFYALVKRGEFFC